MALHQLVPVYTQSDQDDVGVRERVSIPSGVTQLVLW